METLLTLLSNSPAAILIMGACLLAILPKQYRNSVAILFPVLAFYIVSQLKVGTTLSVPFLHYDLSLLRVDKLSKAFGYVFTMAAFAAFIYGYTQKKHIEHITALIYIGSALGVVFAGDLFTLYLFWESMAVASTFLILARKTKSAMAAAKRYILVHIFGGLVLLAGILLTASQSGTLAFEAFTTPTLGTALILIGFLVNAACVPFSSWLPDAYPEATVIGGVILSAYTSKTAVYTLIRGFPGWDILIVLGCVMALYGIIYALLENDIRRILAYSIINQVGFMVCAVGVGTALALNGAVAHAFSHIIYKGLLFMSAGAIVYRLQKSKFTDLGGLFKSMPWTIILGGVGVLAISAMPLTSGYTTKTIIITALEKEHMILPWLALEIASAAEVICMGLFLYAMVRQIPKRKTENEPEEAPKTMIAAMGFLAVLCIYIGLFPKMLYQLLPDTNLVASVMPTTFYDIYIHHFPYVLGKIQLLAFSVLAFFIFLPMIKPEKTITLDIDWLYRRGAKRAYAVLDTQLNDLNARVDTAVRIKQVSKLAQFAASGPATLSLCVMKGYWTILGKSQNEQKEKTAKLKAQFEASTFPIGLCALMIMLVLLAFLLNP